MPTNATTDDDHNVTATPKGRNVVLCCDGTGIGEEHSFGELNTPSNIVRIYNCLDLETSDSERLQIAHYERGVGSVGSTFTKAREGLTGSGIDLKISLLYYWLGWQWQEYEDDQEEDRLFLFGFSRGAFAIRSLVGLIYRCGLLNLHGLDANEQRKRVQRAYKLGYQKLIPKERWAFDTKTGKPWKFHGDKDGRIPIHFVGAFDTVGQLGLPRETFFLWLCGALCCYTPRMAAFHDVVYNPMIRTARHAVAMDEMRSTFQPVFARNKEYQKDFKGQDLKQVWFPGGHANVGGGVSETGLSDGALQWMIDAASKCGLRFQPNMVAQIKPNFQGNIFYKHSLSIYKSMTFYPRSVPPVIMENCEDNTNDIESVHISAIQRSENPRISQAPYFKTKFLQVGQEHKVVLQADKVYNSTFVYMEPGGTYSFHAEGMWMGLRHRLCTADGYSKRDLIHHPFVPLKVLWGKLELGCRRCTGNQEGRLPFTRRHERFPWFAIVGMIASGGMRNALAEAEFHAVFCIGKEAEYQVGKEGGYLYCYANDSWSHYHKNRGFMTLTIRRVK